MQIDKIKLVNFRNYVNQEIVFDKHTNILYGNNAQGKTNILEAIYLLATTKSHRGSMDKDMIRLEQKEAFIHGYFTDRHIHFNIDINLKKSKAKQVSVNKIKLNRLNELIGKVNVIVFSPEDLEIIKSSPSKRRSFIDTELCLINRIYMTNLSYYKKILEQRNKLLKKIAISNSKELLETLDIWDLQLVKYGCEIIEERSKFIDLISEIARELNFRITNNVEKLDVIYNPNINKNEFLEKLRSSRERDIHTLVTNVGPHRDDIEFYLNNIDVKTYGSQGQKRTVALVLKLSEIRLVKDVFNKDAILLLDDVLSELDRSRQTILLDMVEDSQTFITCTGMEEFIENKIDSKKIYKVTKGSVEEVRR